MNNSTPIARVQYHLDVAPWSRDDWRVRRMELHEAIAQPYRLTVVASLDSAGVDGRALLGREASFEMCRAEATRRVTGIVSRVVEQGVVAEGGSGRLGFELTIVPALALASQRVDTRIFQERAPAAVVAEVLKGTLTPRQRHVVSRLTTDGAARDYCVQYRERDLEFCRRVLEEAGLFYVFEQVGEGPERVVLLDDVAGAPVFEAADGTDEIALGDEPELGDRECLRTFTWTSTLASNGVTRSDFDPSKPHAPIVHELRADEPTAGEREIYRHGQRRWTHDDGRDEVRRELESIESHRVAGHGRGNAIGLGAGVVFRLGGHGEPSGTRLLVTSIVHRGDNPWVADDRDAVAGPSYVNAFEAVRAELPYRLPEATERPHTQGQETATVVGPPGEEIHTDALGRIKVAFHWDRRGARDDSASCWLRVAQTWAGHGFGTVMLPRVGMEVVVGFFAGNPDRPYVAGCMYNGANEPPYPLPDNKTKTTLRTASSPGGDGHNEVSFEDAAGHEQIYLHAQRDLDEVVRARHTVRVGGDEIRHVGGQRKTTIDQFEQREVAKDSVTHVHGSHAFQIGGNQHVVVLGGEGSGDAVEPEHPGAELFVHGTYTLDVRDRIVFKCGETSIELTPKGISIVAAQTVTLQAGPTTRIAMSTSRLQMYNDERVTCASFGVELELAAGCATIEAADKVKLMAGDSRLTLDLATARLRSLATSVLGRSVLDLEGPQATVTATNLGMSSTTVSITGEASTRLTGGGAEAVLEAGTVALNDA